MLRFNGQRAQNTIIVTFIQILVLAVELSIFHFQYDYPINLQIDILFERKLHLSEIMQILRMVVTITQNIVFVQWFRRAYYNLHQNADNLAYTDGWAVASWFIPIINLYRPFIIMKELYIETARILLKKYHLPFNKLNIKILLVWWIVYLSLTFLSWYSLYLELFAEGTFDIEGYQKIIKIEYIILIVFYLIHIKVIGDYSDMENLWNKFESTKLTNEHDLDENE